MQAVLDKDRTTRLAEETHYTLKLISLNTGRSVKDIVTQAVELLAKQDPALVRTRTPNRG